MSKKIDEIMKQISNPKIKCVSFDMFDTLVQRPVLAPEDLFHLMGNILGGSPFFTKRRIAAQNRAMLLKDYYTAYVGLDDIYKHYQIMFGTSDEETEKMKQTELTVERKLLFARKSVKKLYDYAILKGKKVIIITDMYLSSDFLEEVLRKNGYKKWYKLYVSCEENATKRSGELFDRAIYDLSEIGIYEDNIIHLGDDLVSDIEMGKQKGIKTIHIPSASSCFNECTRLRVIEHWKSTIYPSSQTLMLGLYACVVFDDPFRKFDKTSRYNGERTLLGAFIAPFLISFCLWLIEQAKEDGIECLAFVWRDGFLPEKIIDLLRPYVNTDIPSIERVYLSRALRCSFAADKKGGLFDSMFQWTLNPQMSIVEFAESFMNCSTEEEKYAVYNIFADKGYTSSYAEIGETADYSWFIHELEPLFIKTHATSREIISEKITALKNLGKLGVFDIGYRGTVSRFLAETFQMKSISYHMLGTMGADEKNDDVVIKPYIKYSQNIVQNTNNILHEFMELIISEQTPGILKYEKDENGIQEIKDPFFEEDRNVTEIQSGVIGYTALFAELFGEYISYMNIDRQVLFTMVVSLLSSPNKKDAQVIKDLRVTVTHYASVSRNFDSWFNTVFGKES